MLFDPLYLLIVGPGILLSLWATFKVKATFSRYADVPLASLQTGAQIAEALLRQHQLRGVRVEPHEGWLSDHYDPASRVVRLSPAVYHGRSISAVGVAAHECGHAFQHAEGYAPMAIRQHLVVPANVGSTLGIGAIVLGAIIAVSGLIWLGIILFSAAVLFQLVTLPVELNASVRAKRLLVESGLISRSEEPAVSRVLSAAAMTYVAALITSVLTLLYYLIRFTGLFRSSDD